MTAAATTEQAATARDSAAAGDSIAVAVWTLVSRITGVVKIAAIGAVLGLTFFGNAYQFTNSLPNLIYFGLLAGSLFSSLLVPALVGHIDAGDRAASERVAGGFLGMTLVALGAAVPLAVLFGPAVLSLAASGAGSSAGAQEQVGRWLILMFIPQLFLYGVVGAATASMNACRRFALAAAAPAFENIGTIAVLAACAIIFGTGTRVDAVPNGELLLLGLGTTGAVALHAAAQWWGAKRAGIRLVPRAGWRDAEVRVVVRRALPSMAQAGLVALQVLTLLVLANRVAGGVVAFQIALNFYFLAVALGATPVALSLLPRLARMHVDGDAAGFRDTLVHGYALGLFIAIPAAVGYLGLAVPMARAISFGRMGTANGVMLVAGALAALSVAVVAQTAFMIATYTSYARKDTRSPLISMTLQALTCLSLASIALTVHGTAVLVVLGLAYSTSIIVAALHLSVRLARDLGPGQARLGPSLARTTFGAVVMIGPAWLVARACLAWIGPPLGSRIGIVAATAVGILVFLAVQTLLRTPELAWLSAGLDQLRQRVKGTQGDVSAVGTPPAAAALARRTFRLSSGWANRFDGIWRYQVLPAGILAAALGVGGFSVLRPRLALVVCVGLAVIACVAAWPALGGYLVIAATPLTAGIDRGHAVPVLRPSEAIAVAVGVALAARALVRWRTGAAPRMRLSRVEWAIVLMALSNSVVPMLWMIARQQPITQDDILYALVMWKFAGIYLIVRSSITTYRQAMRCYWLSLAAASIVAVLAILQSLGLFGVQQLLASYYAPFGYTGALEHARGSSTLALPAATADLLIYNLAIVAGLWIVGHRHRTMLAATGMLFIVGALSAGEFSSAIGLVVGICAIALVTSYPRLLSIFVPITGIAIVVLRPVIAARLSGFDSVSGLPVSWTGRLENLRTHFWPTLFSHWNFLLGVRPSARVPVSYQATGYVWIESGYTWLLWGGGLPLLASFIYFVRAALRSSWLEARYRHGAPSVAALAVFVAVTVMSVLMIFDPHLTYRGAAEEFFALLALAGLGQRIRSNTGADHQVDVEMTLTEARS
ncbi:MAG: putative peptidoglycan lipid flippase [Mycobacterium sp.]|nr:putative peptidoglycan lipid flippase [Mycobacterium sp.]